MCPHFETLPIEEVKQRTGSAVRPTEYQQYISNLGRDQAGRLTLTEGETMRGIRVRLTRAAKAAGTNLKVAVQGDTLYFWPAEPVKHRRGRRPKSAEE